MPTASLQPYVFNATVVSVHDGDTIKVDLDQGLDEWHRNLNVRFDGCNAAELGTAAGTAAAANLKALLPVGTRLTLRSVSWDKYGGRVDADVIEVDGTDLIQTLIAQQWLAAWNGAGTRPVPIWPRTVTP
jgi:endonuclease YncB( thermonuclease family)